jgi:hypothetical protein
MIRKRSSFWTVIFSFLPGGGHMFMGFMKLGLSLMTLFFFTIFISSWLDLGALVYLIPIIWFYAFFDCVNKRFSSDQDFARFEDHFLFSKEDFQIGKYNLNGKFSLIGGIVLLLLGLYIIWRNFFAHIINLIAPEFFSRLMMLLGTLPQLIIGAAIIALGVWLIIGKKKENDKNA